MKKSIDLGSKLNIDFVVTYSFDYGSGGWESTIYIIDVVDNKVYSKSKSFPTMTVSQDFISFAEKVFLAYEAEFQSTSTSGKQVAVITDEYERNAEPWTGIWEVRGFRSINGQWAMKQTDKAVISTSESLFDLEGSVHNNKLKGKIIREDGITERFEIFISPDGQSFEGKLFLTGANMPLKGERRE